MNIRPIISDEQLRDFRDGLLPEPERRLVVVQLEVDESVAQRFVEIRAEMNHLELAVPTHGFALKIMAQLNAETLVKDPVRQQKPHRLINVFFVVFVALFMFSLLILLKNMANANIPALPINLEINWAKIFNSRAFLGAVWLGCLLPGILLVYRKFTATPNTVFGH